MSKKSRTVFCFMLTFVFLFSFSFGRKSFASAENFSHEKNFLNEILELTKDRSAGSEGEKITAEFLSEKLNNLGLEELFEDYIITFNFKNKTSQNVVAWKNNGAEKFVVIGAHYDNVFSENNYGFNDNLSGVLCVANLAEYYSRISMNYNLIFAFYGAEEVGIFGSQNFLKILPENIKNNILLSINLDSIGEGKDIYYFHTDQKTNYGSFIDDFYQNSEIKKMPNNYLFSSRFFLGLNYSHLGLQSDNARFIKEGINSLLFFAGDLNQSLRLGFAEYSGKRIMHITDTQQTQQETFGDSFYENVSAVEELIISLLSDAGFETNFFPGQIDINIHSQGWLLAFGFITITVLFLITKILKKFVVKV